MCFLQFINDNFSVLLSADETKSPGPFEETCKFSISPKSLINDLEAFIHAFVIKFICGEFSLIDLLSYIL